jgi:VacB/RNase II family 3'-5' exoribonuclease
MKEIERMKEPNGPNDLRAIAHKAMTDRGLEPDFPPDAILQLNSIHSPARETDRAIRDLRTLLWCSIDNDTSRDLDQLTVAEKLPAGAVIVLVAVADVDAIVKPASPIDRHARANTTSVYTAAEIFPMLPEKLSTDLTSLGEGEDRLALVVEMWVAADGSIQESQVYRALVNNHAKLAYRSVAAWLDGKDRMPEKVAETKGLDGQLRLQDQIAQVMKSVRHLHGALDLETIEPEAVLKDGQVVDLRLERKNRAQELIEDFMIAANGASAQFLGRRGVPALRRVVRSPERWDAIRKVAEGFADDLPADPDSKALAAFLARRRLTDPLRFPDLSLTIVKLLGRGEYVVQLPGQQTAGHFGLAVRDYSHSTAPNRRFPDLITQRLLKAALAGSKLPYAADELTSLATHCTEQEDAASKVERQVRKSAAAQLLSGRIGETFDALVTGASEKGTWVRLLKPPAEGMLVRGQEGVKVGDQIKVRLASLNVERGFIDFARSPVDGLPHSQPS